LGLLAPKLYSGLVAPSFFAFFNGFLVFFAFLAILFSSLILPGWALLPYTQSGRQSPLGDREDVTSLF
jgi:hypothetical protein